MKETVHLRGLAWNHTRGYLPLIAAAQRFEDLFDGVQISWHKRSLKSFGDGDLEETARDFDLLVVDHPFVGHLAAHPLVESLDNHLPDEFLRDLQDQSVGKSFDSYWFDQRLWAVPIDAAAPVSSARDDLLLAANLPLPKHWEDVCDLARRGLVCVPATPVDSLMNFYMLCCGLGEDPFEQGRRLVSRESGIHALQLLRDLIALCSPECLRRNPIETYRDMVTSDESAYCPFAFGYSNYSRAGYAPAELTFRGLVSLEGRPLRSTLGGAGLAISAHSCNINLAVSFLQFVASGRYQSSLYFSAGGQPAHRSAWHNPEVNRDCRGFFTNTLPVVDTAYLRPRHNGYLRFQDEAGLLIHQFLRSGGHPGNAFESLEDAYSRMPSA
jgi:multiple sugar transport system substrate-binding protein